MCDLMREMAEEEERIITEACNYYDKNQEDEQREILAITMREIGQQEIEKPRQHNLHGVGSAIEYYNPKTATKEYATGVYPTMSEVVRDNKVYVPNHQHNRNSQYGTWNRDGYRRDNNINDDVRTQPWKNRFDDDDGICRDPYAYYSGDWY